jgi:Tol biopolymer transport system component
MLVIRNNERRLYVRDLDSAELRALPGTDNARLPFWSSDSRYVGFSNGDLKVVPISGGAARTVCPGLQYVPGTWTGDTILVPVGGAINRASPSGGGCSPLPAEQKFAGYPAFLPDGTHFIYFDSRPDDGGTFIATLSDPVGRRILQEPSISVFAPASGGRPAHLLYLRDGDLMAQPFDMTALATFGDSFQVAASVSANLENNATSASATANGTLAWLTGISTSSRLTWVDRTGAVLGTVGAVEQHQKVAVSPNGAYAVSLNGNQRSGDLLVTEITRDASPTLLIPRRSIPGQPVGLPVWTRDNSAVWLAIDNLARKALFRKPIDGGPLELIQETDEVWHLTDWSPDGAYLIAAAERKGTDSDIVYFPIRSGTPGAAVPFVTTPGVDSQGQLSPDGKWLAYYSGPATRGDVYIRPFPAGSGTYRVSLNYGVEPRWRGDGKELYFVSNAADANEYSYWSVSVASDGRGGLTIGRAQKMFEARAQRYVEAQNSWSYTPAPEGQRFLVSLSAAAERPSISVKLNWNPGGLRR